MNLLVTGAWREASQSVSELECLGHSVRFLQYEERSLPCQPEWVEGSICNALFQFHPIEEFVNLRYIQLTSAGYDRTPMKYAQEHGIMVFNAAGVYSVPIAEYALCCALQLLKEMDGFRENQKHHRWEKRRGLRELYGKNVVIVGCGNIGTECAKRFKAFGANVIGIASHVRVDIRYDEILEAAALNDVLPVSDIVVLALPLTERTKGLMSQDRFERMKPGAIFINIARGGLVDEKALKRALWNRLGGAALDAFEREPLSENSPLWDMKSVIITPHNSFVGDGNPERLKEVITRNLLAFEAGVSI